MPGKVHRTVAHVTPSQVDDAYADGSFMDLDEVMFELKNSIYISIMLDFSLKLRVFQM